MIIRSFGARAAATAVAGALLVAVPATAASAAAGTKCTKGGRGQSTGQQAPSSTSAPSAATPSATTIASTIPGCDNLATDRGRPVCEIADALGVPAAVFREAFSHVTPAARGTNPSDAQREANHQVLLSALAPYGVTAAQLDSVSDRFRPEGTVR